MKKAIRRTFASTIFGLILPALLFTGANSAAEPVATPAKLNKQGLKTLQMQGKTERDWLKEIPSKEAVGIPAYPGAVFVSYMAPINADAFPAVNLVSEDPPEKVEAWYKKALKGWTYDPTFKLFFDGKGVMRADKLFSTQTVSVHPEKGMTYGLMFVDAPNVKSTIQILYGPKDKGK